MVFARPEVFDQNYIPEEYLYRMSEMQEIARCLSPLLSGHRGFNIKIYGEPATGKTTAVRNVFLELMSETQRATCAYVNCRLNSTKQEIFAKILQELKQEKRQIIIGRGVPFKRIYNDIFQTLAVSRKNLVVALDDLNYIAYSSELNEIFYDLLRCGEDGFGAHTTLVAISSSNYFELDSRVASSFRPVEIEFRPYTKEEIYIILKKRCMLGFAPDAIEDAVVKHAVQLACDLRHGIELLRLAGVACESEGRNKITKEDVEKAGAKVSESAEPSLRTLSREEEFITGIVPATSGEIYSQVREKFGLSQPTCYRMLENLRKLRLIVAEERNEYGRTRIWRLAKRKVKD